MGMGAGEWRKIAGESEGERRKWEEREESTMKRNEDQSGLTSILIKGLDSPNPIQFGRR